MKHVAHLETKTPQPEEFLFRERELTVRGVAWLPPRPVRGRNLDCRNPTEKAKRRVPRAFQDLSFTYKDAIRGQNEELLNFEF